jgi:hypothetical protein
MFTGKFAQNKVPHQRLQVSSKPSGKATNDLIHRFLQETLLHWITRRPALDALAHSGI